MADQENQPTLGEERTQIDPPAGGQGGGQGDPPILGQEGTKLSFHSGGKGKYKILLYPKHVLLYYLGMIIAKPLLKCPPLSESYKMN